MTSTAFVQQQHSARWTDAAELDPAQATVLERPSGESCAVFGAPGSGKTTTLVELLAERISNRGYATREVLAIVPSRLGATKLRDRLALRVGVPTDGPLARTANSVAFHIVQQAAAVRSGEPPRLLTGAEQDRVIAELLEGHLEDGSGPNWPDTLGPDVRELQGFRTEFRELMMRCVESGVSTATLRRLGDEHDRPEWRAAAALIDEYGEVLDHFAASYRDSSELLAEAVRVVTDGTYQTGLRLVAVDDVQEFGPGLFRLLRALAERGVEIAVFGDADVAVSTFRGSDLGALGSLSDRLGVPVRQLTLDRVHRGGPGIRSIVREVTDRVGAAASVAHRAAAAASDLDESDVPPVVRIEASSPAAEYRQIARVLREHHLFRDIPWSRMAVVVRSGALVPAVSKALALAEVPTSTPVGATSIRDAYASRQLIDAAAIATGYTAMTSELIESLATGPLCGLDTVALRRLKRALRHEDIAGGGTSTPAQLLVDAFGHPNGFASIDSAAARRAGRFARTLDAAAALASAGGSIEEVLWEIWSASSLADTWGSQALGTGLAAEEANRHLDAVMALFTAAKRYVERDPANAASGFLNEVFAAEVAEDSLTPQAAADAVWVGTPNSVIGTEVDIVVAAHLQDGAWPNPQLRGSLLYPQQFSTVLAGLPVADIDARAEVLGDELRMFALTVSRARRQVVVSATVTDDEQPSVFLRFRGIADAPLRNPAEGRHAFTLRGLTGQLRRVATHSADDHERRDAASALSRLAEAGVAGAHPRDWYGTREPSTLAPLVDLDDDESFVHVSPSKLETFEKSPLVWFVDTMAAAPSGVIAGIGTVIHAAMEKAGLLPHEEQTIERLGSAALWADVDARWGELQFDAPWIGDAQRRRARELVDALSDYLIDAKRGGARVLSSEGRFSIDAGKVRLTGSIDRVELREDGSVVIIDLKTGKTIPSDADIVTHAQLAAYQLALTHGAIPDAAGNPNGGAALLFVSSGVRGKRYRLKQQEPADAETLDAFTKRLAEVGTGMAAAVFPGAVDLDERDPAAGFAYRIHLIAAVSA
ncbi:Superfamily I DNA or RNA helicase [Paramicrobacterium humi]|uniref:DNA 3'-5' helicase n=1 Tax=Paramicrobacterium humi TaxID=640635 RepID=A0A1H4T920_9MICO|nr:UrvD/REP family ATP-dependent DNA helicase [Microbacterium humi]SEC52827.1 Superfamily I DNA or RNA helicase [Microbacterium humi]